MAYRNNNRRGGGGGNSGGNIGGGGGGGGGGSGGGNFGNSYGNRINPWDTGVGGNRGNNDAFTFANSLINNLLRNQNANQVPSLLDGVQSSRFDDINGYNFIRNRYGKNRNVNGRGIRKPDAVARSKNVLAKNCNKPSNKDALANACTSNRNLQSNGNKGAKKGGNQSGGPPGGSKEKTSSSKVSPYMEVSNDFLYCHMCDKHMYDATSFENHITGRTHRVMKESIEESYRMRATLLRQEARIAEQLKTIEIDRLKRMGKAKNYYKVREYCPMCELFFYGHIIAHRRSEKHLDLKKFLHPKCDDCELEFHNRTEYDDHLLSVVHMKNCKSKPSRLDIERKAKQLIICTMNDELLDIREETAPKKKKDRDAFGSLGGKKIEAEGRSASKQTAGESTPSAPEENGESSKGDDDGANMADATVEDSVGSSECGKMPVEDGVGAALDDPKLDEECPEDEVAKEEESEDCILDYKPGDEIAPEIDNKLPRYKKTRALGLSLIGKLECVECRICHKYFDSEATGEVHARTHSHYRAFIRFLNEKAMEVRIAQKRTAVALEEAEAAKKKQKLADEKKCADEHNGDQANNGETEKKDSELYDPSEATESGDASMAEDGKSDDGQNGSEQAEPMDTEAAMDGADKDSDGPVATTGNDDEAGGQAEVDSGKDDSKDEKSNPKGGNRRGRNARSGRFSGRY
ncbi:zinc finger protein on ecdysone puffs [Anopheles nili]|uniref:zinc finger protein on ecdysone puffs n=1 Tax=Anopheles nili TaxID=185578 RepID=UPI00237BAC45|nr:zinc finger protein on ecdysone puffs [Anopheles nili]